ncbi:MULTISPECIES: ribonuclease III [Aerosakkonema]|uniref:ribonuclease III n=1 Tax=Aerosakkonema TaxID=1246629 RepID=UPI0035BB7718
MAISNHEQVGRALNLLCKALYTYIEQEMQAIHRERWLTVATSYLAKDQNLRRKPADILQEDVSGLLTVILKQWEDVFRKNMGYAERALVSELIEVRNKWAHKSTFSTDDTYRALDSIARLLKAISASEAIDVEKQKQQVLQILSQEQVRQENRRVSAEEYRIRERLAELLKKIPFQDASLLEHALTHRSYFYENPKQVRDDNERLEFLGDAVLGFLCSEFLYSRYPEMNESQLTRLRSELVDEKQLAKFAKVMDIGKWMRLGKGTIADGGRNNSLLLSNTFEAIIGAYFLDSGIEEVREFVQELFISVAEDSVSYQSDVDPTVLVDSKNLFQQWVFANIGQTPPKYLTIKEIGPPHAKEFMVEVRVADKKYGEGKGRSKKDAEKSAAEDALAKLRKRGMM